MNNLFYDSIKDCWYLDGKIIAIRDQRLPGKRHSSWYIKEGINVSSNYDLSDVTATSLLDAIGIRDGQPFYKVDKEDWNSLLKEFQVV